jgi:site-specific DNA recombinase
MLEAIQQATKMIAVYARVSTGRQENEETIKNQLMVVRDLAKKNGWLIVKEYIDDGWSGDILARPDLDKLRDDAKKKIWEAVLMYDPDRLARRYSYQELVMDELVEAGIEVIFTTVSSPKNGEEKLMHGFRGLFAEYERVKIAERFRLGKLRKAREGHLLLSQPKYGYNYILKTDKQQGYYKVDESEAKIVKMIFQWVALEKLTIRGVIKRLLEMKILPRKSKRGVWSTSTLSTLLRSKTYIGEAHYLKSYGVVPKNPVKKETYKKIKKTSRKIRPEEEWIKIPVPAIIDENIFYRAQKILKENFVLCIRNRKNQYLLAGKIFCGCGSRMTGTGILHGKHLYYRCTEAVHTYPLPHKCKAKGLNARIADALAWNKVAKLMTSPELIMAQAKRWLQKRKNNLGGIEAPVAEIKKEIEKLEKEEERYVRAYGSGIIEMDELKERKNDLKGKITALRAQIAAFEGRQRDNEVKALNLPTEDKLAEFCQKAKEMLSYVSFEIKRQLILDVVEKATVNQQEMLVRGYLSTDFNNNHYEFCSIGRNSGFAECGQVNTF